MSVEDVVVARWRRFGKDRLYVTRLDESKVGFWDLVAGEAHPVSPEDLPVLLAVVERWKAGQDTPQADVLAPVAAAAPVVEVAQPVPARPTLADTITASAPSVPDEGPVVRPWVDLATNHAGAEAREQAQAARDAAPVKTVLARVLGVHTTERAWRIGADGEEKSPPKVAKKDPRWRFLHAITVGDRGSDIDHLLIGPGGIFTINAKNHSGAKIWVGGNTFMVDGHR